MLCIKGEFLYKVRTKLHSMMAHILMSWLQEGTEKWKTSFLKETAENADLHKAIFKKTMTTQEKCVKYDFVAPLTQKMVESLWWKLCRTNVSFYFFCSILQACLLILLQFLCANVSHLSHWKSWFFATGLQQVLQGKLTTIF